MARINSLIDTVLFYLMASALGALVGICFIQVVARYLFQASFTWAEEVSIIIMLWATWGAACLAVRQCSHLRVRILEERVTLRTGLLIRVGFQLLAVVFLVVIALVSRHVLAAMENQTLMSLPTVTINTMYLSVSAGTVLLAYYFLRSLVNDCKALLKLRQGKS